MVLCAQFPLIWYATWLLSEKYIVWPFDPTPWVEGVSVGKIFATILLPAWPFDPTPWVEGVSVGKILATMLLPASSALIWYATWRFYLICNMTTFRKIYSLTFWPHPLGGGCVCGQNICYHVVASVVSFNLICIMTIFWKSLILTSAPPFKSFQQARTQDFKLKSL